MKLGHLLDYIFRSQHNQSEFSHLCLLVFLLYLLYTYLNGVRDLLQEKTDHQNREKKRRLEQAKKKQEELQQPQEQAVAAELKAAAAATQLTRQGGLAVSTKQQIIDQLLQEESQPDGFKILRDTHPYLVLMKDDEENPIFRVDAIIDKVTPRQIYEVLRDYTSVSSWYGKGLQCKIILTQGGDAQEKVYSTVHKGGAYPLKSREVIHRHYTQQVEQAYVVSFSTQGLENTASKQKSKYGRAFQSLSGLVLRPGVLNEKGETVAAKVFYITQMEFAGQYVPVADSARAVPQFMVEFLERLMERAAKVK
ncbi:hypothetical protein FGO68_gene7582 [Halteria grandinella]|uniref:START domain-containing protein n=1 Tax=Halteria grandinella TaxID=5974 RepID=A0A8J8T3N0_HALGN|nr:hypothetical protein FGO68_gene7582 [Halteria grandinella]